MVRPAMLYSSETVEVRRRRAAELEGKEMKMFSSEITIDMIKHEWIRARYVGFEAREYSLFF